MKLNTNQEAFESLHERADTKARTVKVSRQQLIDLLMDHSIMLVALENLGEL